MSERMRNILAALFFAVAISLIIHFVLFAIVATVASQSVIGRVAEAMLAPAGALTERILPGHTLAQLVYDFLISVGLYTLALWPVVTLVRLRRFRV